MNKNIISLENIAVSFDGEKITTRLSNGLEAIHDGEVDSIVIAGMGGELVIHILTVVSSILSHAELSAHGTHLNIG